MGAKKKIRFRGHEFFNKSAEWRTAVRWFLLVEDEVCTLVQRRNHSAVYCRAFGRATRKSATRYTSASNQRFSARRRSHIILITDGQAANQEAILEEVSGKAPVKLSSLPSELYFRPVLMFRPFREQGLQNPPINLTALRVALVECFQTFNPIGFLFRQSPRILHQRKIVIPLSRALRISLRNNFMERVGEPSRFARF